MWYKILERLADNWDNKGFDLSRLLFSLIVSFVVTLPFLLLAPTIVLMMWGFIIWVCFVLMVVILFGF